jgi:threonine/homoserine/homoserine lactone efflux protein
MIPEAFTTFLIATLVTGLIPGNDVTYIVSQSLTRGAKVGALAALGITCGMVVHVAALALGLSELLVRWPWLLQVIKVGGAAYLLYLAWRAFRRARIQMPETGSSEGVFWRGALTNVLNPKMALFFLAFIPQFIDPERGHVWSQVLFLGGCFMVSGTLVNLAYALLFGRAFSRVAGNQRFQKAVGRTTGLIFAGLAVRLLTI